MSYNVPLGNSKQNYVTSGGQRIYLGNMVHMMFMAANEGRQKLHDELHQIADALFDRVDERNSAQAVSQMKQSASSQYPHFDRADHYKFIGSGSWGSGNVSGIIELMYNEDTFIQFGIQVYIRPTLFFGSSRGINNVLEDIIGPLSSLYNRDVGPNKYKDVRGGVVLNFENAQSYSYVSLMDSEPTAITWRIGNKKVWDQFSPL